MKLVIKNKQVIATHSDDQQLDGLYEGATIVSTSDTSYRAGDVLSDLIVNQLSVPKQVTRFQALAALHQAGLLVSVETMMQGANTMTKLAWQNALTFDRDSPTVLAIGQALGLSSQNLDDLFIAAAQIKA